MTPSPATPIAAIIAASGALAICLGKRHLETAAIMLVVSSLVMAAHTILLVLSLSA